MRDFFRRLQESFEELGQCLMRIVGILSAVLGAICAVYLVVVFTTIAAAWLYILFVEHFEIPDYLVGNVSQISNTVLLALILGSLFVIIGLLVDLRKR